MFRISGGCDVHQGACFCCYSFGFLHLLLKSVTFDSFFLHSFDRLFSESHSYISPIVVDSFPAAVAVLNISSSSNSKFSHRYFEESGGQ